MGEPVATRRRYPDRRVLLLQQEKLRDVERRALLQRIQPEPSDRIFDIGCSTGKLLDQLREEFAVAEAHGCDVDPAMADPAKNIIVASGENLAGVPDNHYTKVIFAHSLEHFANRLAALNEAYRILQDGGKVYITFFLYTPEAATLPGIAECFDGPVPIVKAEQLRQEIERAGFQILTETVQQKLSSLSLTFSDVPALLIEAEKIPLTTST